MNQIIQTTHRLEISDDGVPFRVPVAGMYKDAVHLAQQGQVVAAISEATRARIEGWGKAGQFHACVVTSGRTISFNGSITDHFPEASQRGMPDHWVIYSEKNGFQITTSETYAFNAQREGAMVKHHPAGEL